MLQHIVYNVHKTAILVRLTCDDFISDPDRSVMQHHAATEHMGGESEPMVMEMIAEPLLLTWEEVVVMPAMRQQAGRGGKAACIEQRQLRAYCSEEHLDVIDLARSAYNWRFFLRQGLCRTHLR